MAAPNNRPFNRLGLPIARGAQSCATCPSALTDGELTSAAGKGVNGPACAIKTLVLTRPNAEPEVQARTTVSIAKNCDKYGKAREAVDDSARTRPLMFSVGMPKPNPDAEDSGLRKPASCQGCAHFVNASEVRRETGWNAGLCLAKGSLLLTDRLATYADGCDKSVAVQWGHEGKLEGFPFMPEYRQDFGKPNLLAGYKKQQAITPQQWPTDRPVRPSDEKAGIRAWRKLEDPEGYGAPVFLPIMNLDALDKAVRSYVPMTGDDEHPEDYIDHAGAAYKVAVMWRGLDETPAVWGQPGTGKTELFRYMAWLTSSPFRRFSITMSTELDDLAGKMHYEPEKGTYFLYGRLPLAWQQPGIICLDEPNVGPPDVWQFIRPLTDNSKQLILDMNEGERIPRHQFAFLGMAMNPAWDSRNVGAGTIGDADQRRLMHIWMGLPPRAVEEEIIRKRCREIGYEIPNDLLNNVMKVGEEIRRMVDNDDLSSITWGVANQIKVAKALKFFQPLKAYSVAVLDYLEPSSAEPLKTVIGSYFDV